MDYSKIILAALISEAIWETSKLAWQQGKLNIDKIGAMIISILVAILIGLDLFELLGFKGVIPVIGEILTGILISRGANFVHDILGNIDNIYMKNKM